MSRSQASPSPGCTAQSPGAFHKGPQPQVQPGVVKSGSGGPGTSISKAPQVLSKCSLAGETLIQAGMSP